MSALAGLGQPSPWQLGLQQSATPVMDNIVWFHDFLLWLITAITLFVLVLLVDRDRALQRARQSDAVADHAQHAASRSCGRWCRSLILVAIAVPSFRLLFYQLNVPPADLTVKATGKQWYWSYSYPDTASSSSTR